MDDVPVGLLQAVAHDTARRLGGGHNKAAAAADTDALGPLAMRCGGDRALG
jgi:hypothetical protein